VLNLIEFYGLIRTRFSWNDFRLYYAGAQVGLRYGWHHIYDSALDQEAVRNLHPAGPWFALLTPPPITWLMVPLTYLPYLWAYVIWVAVLGLALLGAFLLATPEWGRLRLLYFLGIASLYPFAFTVYEGQASALSAIAVLVCWRLLRSNREVWAGLALSLMLLKPHLAVLVPVALLCSGHWKTVAAWAGAVSVMVLLSVASLGWSGTHEYLSMLQTPQPWSDSWLTLGGLVGTALPGRLVQLGVVAVALGGAAAGRRQGPAFAIVLGVLASFLIAGYWHPQDFVVLGAAAAIQLASRPRGAGIAWAAATVALASPLSPFTSAYPMIPWAWTWLVLAVVWLGWLAWQVRSEAETAITRAALRLAPSRLIGSLNRAR
jgi:hypothetical protein